MVAVGVVWEIWAALGLGLLSRVDDDPDGKSLGIRSRSARVAMLRYMWDASELKYTIWRVFLPDGISIRSRAAPRMGRLFPLADFIVRLTGMRSFGTRCSLDMRSVPARQLWQPVSAIAVVGMCLDSRGRVWPWVLKSSAWEETRMAITGCEGERCCTQDEVSLCHVWWGRVPSDIPWASSERADSCSVRCQHTEAVWCCLPHDVQVLPKAGQWIRR